MEPYASRIRDVLERRAKAGRFAPGVAAYSDSDMFKKAPVCSTSTSYHRPFRANANYTKAPEAPRSKRWDSTFSFRSNYTYTHTTRATNTRQTTSPTNAETGANASSSKPRPTSRLPASSP